MGPARALRHAWGIACTDHDQVGIGAHHELGVELGERPHRRRNDVPGAQPDQGFTNKRGLSRTMRRGADLEIHPHVFGRSRQRLRGRRHGCVNGMPDVVCIRHLQQPPQRRHHPAHVGVGLGLKRHHLEPQRLETLGRT